MTSLPNLSESVIRSRAGAKTLARGRAYYESGQVDNVVWRGGLLTAEVQGSEYQPYRVRILCSDQEVTYAHCTCPYEMGGDCKHIVAVLLYFINHRHEIEERPATADLLAPLSREQLSTLLTQLLALHPGLADEVEELLSTTTSASTSPTTSLPTIDTALLRRQIKAELRTSLNTGYDAWGDEAWYDSDLSAALDPALHAVNTYLEAGDPRSALVVLEAATQAWQDGIDSLDEYVMESFEDVAEEFTQELGNLWAEAILTAELDAEERQSWAETLHELSDSIFGGGSLLMAATAAEHGWDYPPLKAAMQGHISQKGAWEDEAPHFADELVLIRLNILEMRGEYAAYLNLAQAEGQFMPYLHMLVKQGQSDKAVAEALETLTQPSDLLALGHTLAKHNQTSEAIQLAQHGLGLEERRGKAELAVWLRNLAHDAGQPELALWAAQEALGYDVSLANYQAVQEAAGAAWATLKPEVLAIVAQGQSADGKVDIYLHEAMYSQAIEVVDHASWFYHIDKVIEAVKGAHPDWAFRQCRTRAEAIMDAGKAKNYDVAAEWLRRGRDILLAAGQQPEWSTYLDRLLDIHQRKYKLMPMLRALR